MRTYKSRILNIDNCPFILFFMAMLLIHLRINVSIGSDDGYYMNILKQDNIKNIISMLTLNNRILINIVIAVFFQMNIWIWKIANVSLFTLLLIVISKLSKTALVINNEKDTFWLNCWTCLSVFLIHINVLSSGAYWITGSFNYLWCATFCLCGIYPFKKELFKEEYNKKIKFAYTLAAIYACYAEQTAAILTCFGTIIIIIMFIQKRKISKYIIIHYVLILINSSILLLLPFNNKRFIGEIIAWYPNFPMLSTMDKLYQGVNHLCNHLINQTTLIMLIITVITYIILHFKYKDKIIRLISMIPFVYFLLKVIPLDIITKNIFADPINLEGILNRVFYNFSNGLFENIQNAIHYLPVISGGTILLLIPFFFFAIYDNFNERIYIILMYLAAVASALALSFSPTIFGSGNRIFFVTDIFLILVMRMLFNKLSMMEKVNGKKFKVITYIFIGLSSIIVLQTMIELSSTIYY